MLRINLLPPYIYDKQKKFKVIALWGLLIAVALGVFLMMFVQANTALGIQKAKQAEAEGYRDKYVAVESDINKEKQRRADIEQRQVFISNAQKYNDAWPAAFEMMRDVTANNILLKSMSFDKSRKVVSFTGFAKDEQTIVKWWEYLRNNYAGPDANLPFDNVSFSLPGHPWPPKVDANAGGKGGPGGSGGGGGFGSSGGGPPPASVNGTAGMGGPSSGGFGGGGGRGGGGGNQKDEIGPGIIQDRAGINFAATVTLKKALADGIATPTWTGGGGAPAAPAGFGGGGAPGGAPTTGGAPGTGAAPSSGGGRD